MPEVSYCPECGREPKKDLAGNYVVVGGDKCSMKCKKAYERGQKPKVKRKYGDNLWTQYT